MKTLFFIKIYSSYGLKHNILRVGYKFKLQIKEEQLIFNILLKPNEIYD